MIAIAARSACGFWFTAQMRTLPSLRTSASVIDGPIGPCFMYGVSYVADTFFVAEANAASALPLLRVLVETGTFE